MQAFGTICKAPTSRCSITPVTACRCAERTTSCRSTPIQRARPKTPIDSFGSRFYGEASFAEGGTVAFYRETQTARLWLARHSCHDVTPDDHLKLWLACESQAQALAIDLLVCGPSIDRIGDVSALTTDLPRMRT